MVQGRKNVPFASQLKSSALIRDSRFTCIPGLTIFNTRKRDRFPLIRGSKFTRIQNEVASYASEYVSEVRVIKLMATFKLYPKGHATHPCLSSDMVFTRLSKKECNLVYVYEYFRDFDISFPLSAFECGLLFVLLVAPSQLHPNIWGFIKLFEVVCSQLGHTFRPCMLIFFYQMKHKAKIG